MQNTAAVRKVVIILCHFKFSLPLRAIHFAMTSKLIEVTIISWRVRIPATFLVMFFLEEALVSTEKLTNPSVVQCKPHFPSDVVLGQLVTERIGMENGTILSFSS